MKPQPQKGDLDRRAVLLGLAGAAALVGSKGSSVLAQEAQGVERKIIREFPSMIPGFTKVRLREVTFQTGASSKRAMPNPMICECTLGSLEVIQDDKTFTANVGDTWTCNTGTVEGNLNKGSTPAIMRVFDLLPA